jgi:hypothetical protein
MSLQTFIRFLGFSEAEYHFEDGTPVRLLREEEITAEGPDVIILIDPRAGRETARCLLHELMDWIDNDESEATWQPRTLPSIRISLTKL